MCKASLFWPVLVFFRYGNVNIEFCTMAMPISGISSMRNFRSTNPKIVAAVMRYFDVLWWDKSIPSVLWSTIFSSHSDCQTWKFYASESPYYGSTLRVKPVKTWRSTATNQLSNRKPAARSRNFGSKPEPEVVLAAILDSESAKCRENARERRRNVGIAVPRERVLTEVQFGAPFPEWK